MIIAKHICFFFKEDRLQYINRIIKETDTYSLTTDIYIHTNYNFSKELLCNYSNGSLIIVFHDLSNNMRFQSNPICFPYFIRDVIKSQKDKYDIFIYLEDDILIPKEALNYWLFYKEKMIANNYNLGFFRIEIDEKGDEYGSDQAASPDGQINEYLTKTVIIDNEQFIINDVNPYCAFWIYDKDEFNKYANSHYYQLDDGSRETVAFGLHRPDIKRYRATIAPLRNNQICKESRVFHMPNNYVHKKGGWVLHLFEDFCKL